jgi:adenylosuccinate synthase
MNNFFDKTGVYVLVDGQFGSTGKGTFASFLAHQASDVSHLSWFNGAISSSGPNSGHTSYFGHAKIVLKQLPTFAVHAHLLGYTIPVYLSAGAIIDPDVLRKEAIEYPAIPIFVHPNAAVVSYADKEGEKAGPIRDIASTQSGTGMALARKIMRHPDSVFKNHSLVGLGMPTNVAVLNHRIKPEDGAYFMEVAQGFSLGINSEFYPHVTSRECTVMQGIADARIPPRFVNGVFMCVRTYPIRVGNLDGHSSGNWYEDQTETSWEELGIEAELTTVTKRVRRVATFSVNQFIDAIRANDPDWVAINFLNYLPEFEQVALIENLREIRNSHRDRYGKWFGLIGGFGPNASSWRVL